MALRASISYASLQVSISSAKPATSITYELVNAAGIWTDPDSKNRFVRDELPLSDVRFNLVEKNLADTTVMQEVPAWHLTKPATPEIINVADVFAKVVAYNRSFTDAFTLDDLSQIDKDFYGNKGNIFAFTDIIGLTHEKSLTDNYTVGDVVENLVTKVFNDNYTFGDTHDTEVLKGLSDATVFADVRVTLLEKALVDSVSTPDEYTALFSLPKEDTLALADNFTKIVAYSRSFTDAFTLDDLSQIDKDFYGNKGNIFAFTDIIGLTHSKNLTDAYTVGDVISVVSAYSRTFSDTTTINDVNSVDLSKIDSDTFTLPDSTSKAVTRPAVDSISLTEIPAIEVKPNKTDSFSMTEVYYSSLSKYLVDGFVLDDGALINKDYTGTKGNIVSFSEVFSREVVYTRAYSDSYTVTDLASLDTAKLIYDEVFTWDIEPANNALGTNALNRSPLNSTATPSATQVAISFDGDRPETLSIADILSSASAKNLTENLTLTEIYGLQLEKALSDGFTLDDAALVDKDYFGAKGNAFGFTDVFARSVDYSRAFTENLSFSEVSYFNTTKGLTDSVGFSEVLEKQLAYVRSYADSTSVTDLAGVSVSKSESDSTSLTDSHDLVANKEVSDSVGFIDGNTLQIVKLIEDGFGLDDAALVNKNYFGNKGNIVGISDQLVIGFKSGGLLGFSSLNTTSLN